MSSTETNRAQEAQIWTILEPVIVAQGYELIEVERSCELGRQILRLYIDHPEHAITVADTTRVTRLVDPVLDVEDPIAETYNLEVSSPGLDRPLRLPAHFERHAGAHVRIRIQDPIAGDRRRNFDGVLKGIHDGVVSVEVDGELYQLPHDTIARARVDDRFDEESRR